MMAALNPLPKERRRQEPEEGDVRVCRKSNPLATVQIEQMALEDSVSGCLCVPYFGPFNDGVPRVRSTASTRLPSKELVSTVYGSGFANSKGSWRVAILCNREPRPSGMGASQ